MVEAGVHPSEWTGKCSCLDVDVIGGNMCVSLYADRQQGAMLSVCGRVGGVVVEIVYVLILCSLRLPSSPDNMIC